jgi:predicted membrane-bound spermidine synthase
VAEADATGGEGAPVRVPRWLYPVFFVSGFAALVYQIAWQRALFTVVGINVETVTLVVSAFMLGLGAGALAGGALSRDPRRPALAFFAAAEIGIGLFGFVSLPLIAAAGRACDSLPDAASGALVFAILLVPTVLMGATLPLLVAYAVRADRNVGRAVGALYGVNTLGSAVASIAATLLLLGNLGISGSVHLAAVANLAVGAAALALWRATR